MVDWQITTTTIYCDAVDDEATLLVYADGSVKCAGYARYGNPDNETRKQLKAKGKLLDKTLGCEGPQCSRATGYRDNLFAEEKK